MVAPRYFALDWVADQIVVRDGGTSHIEAGNQVQKLCRKGMNSYVFGILGVWTHKGIHH